MMQNIKKSLLLLTLCTTYGSFLHAGKLHNIIWKNDIKKVEQFFKNKKDTSTYINTLDNENATPLQIAFLNNNTEMVKLLLSHGADVNTPNCDNNTLLLMAGAYEDIEMVKLLLSHGADINQPAVPINKTPYEFIKEWTMEKKTTLFKQLLLIQQKKVEVEQDTKTQRFIEFNALGHAGLFNQNKTLMPFMLTEKQKYNLLFAKSFKKVKNKEFIISLGQEILNNLFFRCEKNKQFTLPLFILDQSKIAVHPYVKQLKVLRNTQEFKKYDLKSFNDFTYRIKLLIFAQQCEQKWSKKQKSNVNFEDVTLSFKSC